MGESPHGMGKFVSTIQDSNVWSLINFACTTNSADYMQGTRMSFKSKEDAIHFAEKQGEP